MGGGEKSRREWEGGVETHQNSVSREKVVREQQKKIWVCWGGGWGVRGSEWNELCDGGVCGDGVVMAGTGWEYTRHSSSSEPSDSSHSTRFGVKQIGAASDLSGGGGVLVATWLTHLAENRRALSLTSFHTLDLVGIVTLWLVTRDVTSIILWNSMEITLYLGHLHYGNGHLVSCELDCSSPYRPRVSRTDLILARIVVVPDYSKPNGEGISRRRDCRQSKRQRGVAENHYKNRKRRQ